MAHYVATPSLGFGAAISSFFKNLFKISGRSRRSEYWWVVLLQIIMILATIILAAPLGIIPVVGVVFVIIMNAANFLFALLLIPLAIRRLHDIGRSGWWIILPFIVIFIAAIISVISLAGSIGKNSDTALMNFLMTNIPLLILLILFAIVYPIIMIIFHCLDSQMGDNKYGPSPKYILTEGAAPTFMGMNGAQMYAHTTTKSPEM